MMSMAIFAIPQLFGLVNDDLQMISIQLFDHVDNTLLNIESAEVILVPSHLRFYKAEVTIMAQLEGLQYYMKKWFIVTLSVIVAMMSSTMFFWLLLATYTVWKFIKNRIDRHLDYANRENSMLKLYILRSIF